MPTALEGDEGVSVTPRPLFTPGKTPYPLYRRVGGPQGRSGQVQKILPSPGFDPWTVQPVASRYTNYATWPTESGIGVSKINCECVSLAYQKKGEHYKIKQMSNT
jgi:hypothetical protein